VISRIGSASSAPSAKPSTNRLEVILADRPLREARDELDGLGLDTARSIRVITPASIAAAGGFG
jgi:hypothetical protein